MSKPLTPQLRFKGFTDEWKQAIIRDVLCIGNGCDYKHLSPGDIPVFGTGGLLTKVNQHLYEGETVFIGRKGTIDKPAYYNGKFWTVDTLFYTHSFVNSIPRFIFPLFENIPWYLYNAATGVPSLSKETILSIDIKYPSLSEQREIGEYFRNLDWLIAEVEKEVGRLEKMKIASLQKMFPRPGATSPEVRFNGFTDEWKETALGNIAEKVNTKNSEKKYNETFTCSAEFGIISQIGFFDHSISKSANIDKYLIAEPNTYVYNPRISSFAPFGPIIRNKLGRTGVISPLYTLFHFTQIVDYTFIDWYFKTNLWHNFMVINGDSGARHDRFTIRTEVFFQMPILLPALAEQQAIGEYFRNLDTLIVAKRKKLAKLRNIKASCLDKMFVKSD